MYLDSGINKPFDRLAKKFADEAPELFLRLLGLVPRDAVIALKFLRPETSPPVTMPDYVAELSIPGREVRTLHIEFVLWYRRETPETITRYGCSLALQYGRPVTSVLLLLQEHGVTGHIPAAGEYVIGGTKLIHPFETVRLWELDPAPLLAWGDQKWLAWALLMRLDPEEMVRIGARIRRTGDEELIAQFLTLGNLRYPREVLESVVGGERGMTLHQIIVEGSSVVAEVSREDVAKSLKEGRIEGRIEGKREILRLFLTDRFPGLESMPELDLIHNTAEIEDLLLRHASRTHDRAAVEQAILEAARRA